MEILRGSLFNTKSFPKENLHRLQINIKFNATEQITHSKKSALDYNGLHTPIRLYIAKLG